MKMNVINEYTYTLETIVQAGRNKMAIMSVPIRTNGELRPSRLFHSMMGYVKKSMLTILRAYMMYRPLMFFTYLGTIPFIGGLILGIRYIVYLCMGQGGGKTQSLLLCIMLIIIAFICFVTGMLGDLLAANRKILQDIQYKTRKMYYDSYSEKENQESDSEDYM
jgi:hypothetical protein